MPENAIVRQNRPAARAKKTGACVGARVICPTFRMPRERSPGTTQLWTAAAPHKFPCGIGRGKSRAWGTPLL